MGNDTEGEAELFTGSAEALAVEAGVTTTDDVRVRPSSYESREVSGYDDRVDKPEWITIRARIIS